jgi:uncharacterized protein
MRKGLQRLAIALGLCAAAAVVLGSCDLSDSYRILMRPASGDGVEVSSFASTSTGTEYAVYVGLPRSYANDAAGSYPVLFLLDGDSYFSETHSRAQALAAAGSMPEAIIVGIGYGSGANLRTRDYTPTSMKGITAPDGSASGGAGAFLAFIKDELLPWVEAGYRVSPDRASRGIMGHSYGGLFALYALFMESDAFGCFIASSPTIAWGDLVSFSYLDEWSASGRSTAVSLFLSRGAGDGFPEDALVDQMARSVGAVSGAAPASSFYQNTVHANVWRQAFPDGMAAVLGGAQ